MSHLKIALVGGGSVNWTPRIGHLLQVSERSTCSWITQMDKDWT